MQDCPEGQQLEPLAWQHCAALVVVVVAATVVVATVVVVVVVVVQVAEATDEQV